MNAVENNMVNLYKVTSNSTVYILEYKITSTFLWMELNSMNISSANRCNKIFTVIAS